ncbi:MAG: archaellin/type IV pilin N-terminal domain-containing protein [Nanobdellota archaeon]
MAGKKAEMGIGTLILFIAMILVAAVAAGVLIQTASSLQAKALLTGSKSTSEVSTALTVTRVYGMNASAEDHELDRTYMNVRLAPGSDPIKFDDLVINVDTANFRNSLVYSGSMNCSDPDNMTNSTYDGNFGVKFLSSEAKYSRDYLYRGDNVQICFENPEKITEGKDYKITAVPKAGSQSTVSLRAPDVLVKNRIDLYP